MTVTCVIQARMGSTRLPGKVMADLAGRPMLQFQLERLLRDPPGTIVIATSTSSGDDPVADLADRVGVPCVRGSELDVLDRFIRVLEVYPADTVVRLTGDCPLSDPMIVREALDAHRTTRATYVSNTLIRTFPDGLDVEVVDSGALLDAAAETTDLAEREHVTPYVYRHPERYSLSAIRSLDLLGDERWTVDTLDDLAFVRRGVGLLDNSLHFTWREFLQVAGTTAPALHDSIHLRPAASADAAFVLALRNDPDAVRFSGTGETVDVATHAEWFAERLSDPSGRIWIAHLRGESLGMVRIAVRAAVATVSLAIAPFARGRGLGRCVLAELDRVLLADQQVCTLRAEIRRENPASIRTFERAGYTLADESDDFLVLARRRSEGGDVRGAAR